MGVRVEKFSTFTACFFTLDYCFSDDPINNRTNQCMRVEILIKTIYMHILYGKKLF